MTPIELTNQQLFDELSRRLREDCAGRNNNELMRLEEEMRRLNIRLRESESSKSHFLSNVRNEINNPLTAIIGLAASIRGITYEEKVKHLSTLIHRQASELDFQMRNIIVAAEIESGDVSISPALVDVVSMFENIIESFRYRTDERKVIVQCEVAERLKFKGDMHVLETICINLLANAIEYSGSNRLVIAELEEQDSWLQIVIRDFGQGISDEAKSALFQPFKQGESGTTKVHRGHGLGLSIVNALVSLVGGTIALTSDVGTGTTVTVRIPELDLSVDDDLYFGNELIFRTDQKF